MDKNNISSNLNLFDPDTRKGILKNMPGNHKIIFSVVLLISLIILGISVNNSIGKPLLDEKGNFVVIIFTLICIILIIILLFVVLLPKKKDYAFEKEKIQEEVDTKDEDKMKHWMMEVENNVLRSHNINENISSLLDKSELSLRHISGINKKDTRYFTADSYLETIHQLVKERKLGDVTIAVRKIWTYKLAVTPMENHD